MRDTPQNVIRAVLSIVLSMVLAFGMVPFTAMADGNSITVLADEYIDLSKNSGYTVDSTVKVPGITINNIKINSSVATGNQLKLTKAGNYVIELIGESITYKYNAILFRRGDVNIDSERDIRDLVAIARKDNHTSEAENYGADLDGNGTFDSNDNIMMRNILLEYIKPVTLFDFSKYSGSETTPNAYTIFGLENGSEYTLSFEYYVKGNGTPKLINAAKEWLSASSISFPNNTLSGEGTYTYTFTADYTQIIPVFQNNITNGAPKLYVWNMSLVKSGTDKNIAGEMVPSNLKGDLVNSSLVSVTDIEPSTLSLPDKYIGGNTWLIDFSQYTGDNLNPSTYFTADVESGQSYTFSFNYCVIGESTGTKVLNAAKEWGLGSQVNFENNVLSGKGTYITTFTADTSKVIPVFQTHTPYGTPQLYVWDIKVIKNGTDVSITDSIASENYKGVMADDGLVNFSDVDTDLLQPFEEEDTDIKPVWLFDFAKYSGSATTPNAYTTLSLDKGSQYTFSFDYYVNGNGTPKLINAAKEWQSASSISFPNNTLSGKGTYTYTFTADHTQIIPVFQTNLSSSSASELYVWNVKLIKSGSLNNSFDSVTVDSYRGDLKNSNLITISEMNITEFGASDILKNIEEKDVWLFNYSGYSGSSTTPNAYTTLALNSGSEYTFSFEYCVNGKGTPKLINAAKEWQSASSISFPNNSLSGKGTYTYTFTADYTQIIPVFQTNIALGAPELYIWDIKLIKTGSETNVFDDVTVDSFRGDLKNSGLITVTKMNPDTASWSDVWMLDFTGYDGEDIDINAYTTLSINSGSEYTLSFDYAVEGIGTPKLINAENDWNSHSSISFPDNTLSGRGTYTYKFTADYSQIIPVFEVHKPYGTPRLYLWNVSLKKTGNANNLMSGLTVDNFRGSLKNNDRIKLVRADTDSFVEQPVTDNTAVLYNERNSSYDATAEAKISAILSKSDTLGKSQIGTTYYVSPNGNDNNNGTSSATAWRTLAKVSKASLNPGDVVLFKRGGVYRGDLALTSGARKYSTDRYVKYGAYGTGSKPCIYGSLQNYARPWLWETTTRENVWKICVGDVGDVGNIVFNHGVKCGYKTIDNSLVKNFDFYYDANSGYLYLYYSVGNPGLYADDIEICNSNDILHAAKDTTYVSIENLCLKYSGARGIVFATGSYEIDIKGCEIGYIGGCVLPGSQNVVRYGNGIELLDNCAFAEIQNNWVYQCYDSGITHQSSNTKGCTQREITISDNLVEYCTYNLEYYVDQSEGFIKNTVYENNILRFAGYGFGSVNRIGSDNSMDSNICAYARISLCENFVIRNNVLDSPKYYQTTIGCPNDSTTPKNYGPTVTHNTYIQSGKYVAKLKNNGTVIATTATDLASLTTEIAKIDNNPESITFEN